MLGFVERKLYQGVFSASQAVERAVECRQVEYASLV